MSIPSGLLPDEYGYLFDILLVLVVAFVAYYTPWYRFSHSQYRHVFFGSVIGMMVLWNVDAGALPALNFHFLGAMLITLMFRWQYTIWAMMLVILSQLFTGKIDLSVFAMNSLLFAVVPVYVGNAIYKFVDRRLPNHFFIYVYGAGFFGAAIVVLTVIMMTALLLLLFGVYEWSRLVHDFLRYSPLMMFIEAFITGMLTTLLVVFRPQWVSTFDDDRYLKDK